VNGPEANEEGLPNDTAILEELAEPSPIAVLFKEEMGPSSPKDDDKFAKDATAEGKKIVEVALPEVAAGSIGVVIVFGESILLPEKCKASPIKVVPDIAGSDEFAYGPIGAKVRTFAGPAIPEDAAELPMVGNVLMVAGTCPYGSYVCKSGATNDEMVLDVAEFNGEVELGDRGIADELPSGNVSFERTGEMINGMSLL
jgi:hypothetical protein